MFQFDLIHLKFKRRMPIYFCRSDRLGVVFYLNHPTSGELEKKTSIKLMSKPERQRIL